MWAHLPCVAMAPLVNQNDKTARSYHLIVACTSCNHFEKLQFGKKKKKICLERQQFAPTRVWEEGEFSAKISSSDAVVIC